MPLPAVAQPGDQARWKTVFRHLLLGSIDVIGYTVVQDDAMVAVVDGIACARVAVARLSHTAGIDDLSGFPQKQRNIGRELCEDAVLAVGHLLKHYGNMAVPHKAVLCLKIIEADTGAVCRDQVLPDRLARAAVSQGKITFLEC